MEFINIGKIVNTHGIKGELRILSDFRHKDKVFKVGMKFYVGREKEEFIVNSYRFHKIFDMVTFKGFNNINDVLYLKGRQVFINKEDLVLDDGEIYIEDLIGYEVFIGDKNIGKVTDIIFNPKANDVATNSPPVIEATPHPTSTRTKVPTNSQIYFLIVYSFLS